MKKIKKKTFWQVISLLIIFLIFFAGWFFLEFLLRIIQKPFDFEIYLESSEGEVSQEKSITSTVIVFSDLEKTEPVELYVSNCPKNAVCELSIKNASPTFTSDLIIKASESTPLGLYTVNVFAVSSDIQKTITYYLTVKSKECICTEWISRGCGGSCVSQMYMTRICEPQYCGVETKCVYNETCIKDFSIESIPSYKPIIEQKATFVINISSMNNFTGLVNLYTDNCAPGALCSYSPNKVNITSGGFATSLLTVTASLDFVLGNFTITTTGSSNNITHSINSSITII